MERLLTPLRVAIVGGVILSAVAAGWLAWKVYHQIHTPIRVFVIER